MSTRNYVMLAVLILLVQPGLSVAKQLWTQTDPSVNATHIFQGEINRRGKPTGFHAKFNGQTPKSVRILRVKGKPNKAGVYTAEIAIQDKDTGEWKEKFSSMFPDELQITDVVKAIVHAYKNREKDHSQPWRGPSGHGFPIEGYLLKNGNINTAYPIYVRDR